MPPVARHVAAVQAWVTTVHAARLAAVQTAHAARLAAVHTARLAADHVPPPAQLAAAVPDRVLRGVALATVAAVGMTGAGVALAGPAAPDAGPVPDGAAVVPSPALIAAAGPAALTVPGLDVLTVPAPDVRGGGTAAGATALPPGVLDPAALRRAVARAQADARRLAEPDEPVPAQADDEQADTDGETDARDEDERTAGRADPAAEDERTADRARRAGRAADPDAATSECDLATGGLGPVKPHVRAAAEFLGCAFGEPTVLGVAGRSNASDHPHGLALDFLVDRTTGDALAACAIRNRAALGVSYVIWRQRIDTGDGFRAMPDRGSATANHFDHVHVSFEPRTGTGTPSAC